MSENGSEVNMLLAGDIGGTKTLVGLFDPQSGGRPRPIVVREFSTLDGDSLESIVRAFLEREQADARAIESATFGVAGPVIGNAARLTNVPWGVGARDIADAFHIQRVTLLNDLEAMAYGVTVLAGSEIHVLQQGQPLADGHMAIIAAGTGLGEAFLHNIGGRFVPAPSEGGHADFAARTEAEILLLRDLIERYGRAEVEHVASGRGLVNIHRVTHLEDDCPAVNDESPDAPAAITRAALEGRCDDCIETLRIFVDAYGAEAGNLALRTVATAGVFIGGGIAPKILPALTDGRFMRAFTSKAPFESMLASVPVSVVLNPQVGLIGASVHAAWQAAQHSL
jgi:glucokinase